MCIIRRSIGLLLFGLIIFAASACSSKTEEETTETEPVSFVADFYSLTDEGTTLLVELPADQEKGYSWEYEISDENILTLTSYGFTPADENGEGAKWRTTYASPGTDAGNVTLKLFNGSKNSGMEPDYVMELDVSVEGKITVKSIRQ